MDGTDQNGDHVPSPAPLEDARPPPDSDAILEAASAPTEEAVDISMVDDNDAPDTKAEAKEDAMISDNPLDAPDAPQAENDMLDDEDEDDDKQEEGSPEKEGLDGDNEQTAQTKASLESSARSHLIAQTHAIILPSYSTWFDMRDIHALEKKALPEFFNARNRSKTPAVYKDYRDFMINTYRLNPSEYLTFTACRRNLAGDVCAIMRVHAFLEQWGLINYQIDPETRPSNIGPPFTGHFRITADTPRGLQPFQPSSNAKITSGRPSAQTDRLAAAATPSKSDLNLEVRRNIYEATGKEVTPQQEANGDQAIANGASLEASLKDPPKQVFCHSCGKDCTRVRYHNSKSAAVPATGKPNPGSKYDVCPNCYAEARFPASTQASDYVKLENESYDALPDRDRPWTDAETLLLLEGLELFDDDWTSVAEHVSSRTREQCVLKFLQLEIEDKYLDAEAGGAQAEAGANGTTLAYLSGGRVPFSQSDNPVMSVVGFLAGAVDPAVAAAAAGRTVEEMRRVTREKLEKSTETAQTTSAAGESTAEAAAPAPTTDETVKTETAAQPSSDAMEVDALATTESSALATMEPPNATVTALALTAARSSFLASHTERHLSSLLSLALTTQTKKLELKLSQFAEMEALLNAERRELERARRELFLERIAWRRRCEGVREGVKRAVSGAVADELTADNVRGIVEALAALGVGGDLLEVKPVQAAGDEAMADVKPVAATDPTFANKAHTPRQSPPRCESVRRRVLPEVAERTQHCPELAVVSRYDERPAKPPYQ
ncbi:hypothetical protein MRB53_040360 [Persea americana]|nr:hypothetical protein MRB53_040360 [Persea americana]